MYETRRAVDQSIGSGVSENAAGAFIFGGNLGLSQGQVYGGPSVGFGLVVDVEAESSEYVESYNIEDFNRCHYVNILG